MDKIFEGRTALISGGSTGIGRATALLFAQRGARCLITHYDSTDEEAERTVGMIEAAGGEAFFIKADAADAQQSEAAVAAIVERYGRLDMAFNNAMHTHFGPVVDMTEAEWDRSIQGVLKSVWLGMKHQIRQMLAQGTGGAIVNTSSTNAVTAEREFGAYGSGKRALMQLSRIAALEHSPDIRINCVLPGPIMTEGQAKARHFLPQPVLDRQAYLMETTGAKRWGKPSEVGEAVVWLCSDAASFVTGADLLVDGGWSLR